MTDSTFVFVLLVAGVLWLLGVRMPGRLIALVFLAWLIWEIFFLRDPRHAGNMVQQGLRDFIEFLKSVTT
jgi:hypothetical protein